MQRQTESMNAVVRFFRKPYRYAAAFSLFLAAASAFTLLDAFVIPRAYQKAVEATEPVEAMAAIEAMEAMEAMETTEATEATVAMETTGAAVATEATVAMDTTEAAVATEAMESTEATEATEGAEVRTLADPAITATSYKDENIDISIETLRAYDTDVYIADVKVSGATYLKAAFAKDIYGRNINEKTSAIADKKNAIFAVNGDYYGFRDYGWVLRNGVLYRSTGSDGALLMDMAGDFSYDSDDASIAARTQNLWQIWSFGPPLVVGGAISVTEGQEISGRSSNSNPRTAIGQAGELHYVFIVSDGRARASAGLSLYELAMLFEERGCHIAYNLDGGGSSAMYFNGRVINNPTTDGRKIREREVSDIVYIGY